MANLIGGIHSGHDCAYCVLEDGKPIIHAELERYLRVKEPFGDAYELMQKDFPAWKDVQSFAHTLCTWKGGLIKRHHDSYRDMWKQIAKHNGIFSQPGHHESHAANAFFSSDYDEALIVTIDGGGRDYYKGDITTTCTTFWTGKDNKLQFIDLLLDSQLNIGGFWASIARDVLDLSVGYPKGNQCGTVMAMAGFGDPERFLADMRKFAHNPYIFRQYADFYKKQMKTERDRFDISAALQKHTEEVLNNIMQQLLEKTKMQNVCLAGGVALNSVWVGKLLDVFKGINIYIPPVPPDSGLAIGNAQYAYHVDLDMPRVDWGGNASPYLGKLYSRRKLGTALNSYRHLEYSYDVSIEDLAHIIAQGEIVSVFNERSESGRRALGNRSILADPRPEDMKQKINDKVKHRQWFRPFAPSILRERVGDWFKHDVDSPYMSLCLEFKEEKKVEVPAVVHIDGTARLQTVTEKDNKWYYSFLKAWEQ